MPKREGEPISCLVPHCRGRSWKWRRAAEYLCSKHYRLADASWRAYRHRIMKAADKAEHQGYEVTTARAKAHEIWEKRIKPQVLARAFLDPEPVDELPQGRIVRAPKQKPDF